MIRGDALRRLRLAPFLLVVLAAGVLWAKPMGLLFWARIRILTNIPRTAIAEPEHDLAAMPRIELPPLPAREAPLPPRRDPFAAAEASGERRP
jgi:hypothetical protein